MSRKDDYDSTEMEKPTEKMAALEEELAKEEALRSDEEKYAPHLSEKKSPGLEKSATTAKVVKNESEKNSDDVAASQPAPSSRKGESHSEEKETDSEEDDDNGDDDEIIEEEILEEEDGKRNVSSLVWNIMIVVIICIIGVLGVMYYQQMQTMPKTPLENAMEEYKMIKKKYMDMKMASFDVQKRQITNELYLQKLEQIASLEETVELKKKKLEDLKREIMGVRGEIRSYFSRYKANARKKARNLHFDNIMTVKTGQTYLDVTIQRVNDDYVSIVHAGGAVRLEPDDLPEAVRTRLAYGDPLDIAMMDDEIRQQQQDSERAKPSPVSIAERLDSSANGSSRAKAPYPANSQPVRSAAPPRQIPVSSAELEPPSRLPSVSTKSDPVTPSAPASAPSGDSSGMNWKPAPVPSPFVES